jgi:hypothetical protein
MALLEAAAKALQNLLLKTAAGIFALTIICLFAISPVPAKMLEGKVEHSVTLPPTEASLRPGNRFHEGAAIANSAFVRNHWFRIPNWLAGNWHYDERTTTYQFDYLTGHAATKPLKAVDIATRTFGHQMDAKGNVWQFDQTPYTVESESDDAVAYTLRQDYVPVGVQGDPSNATKFTVRILANQLRVDKVTNEIKSSSMVESIQTFSLERDGNVRLEYSEKIFDVNGHPDMLRNGYIIDKKVSNFAHTDELQNKDLKELFQDFLVNSSRTHAQ